VSDLRHGRVVAHAVGERKGVVKERAAAFAAELQARVAGLLERFDHKHALTRSGRCARTARSKESVPFVRLVGLVALAEISADPNAIGDARPRQ
jgi:hypothetical protein